MNLIKLTGFNTT